MEPSPEQIVYELRIHLEEAESRAWDALSRYKFQQFGYWAAIWVHLNRISGGNRPNPWRELVFAAREAENQAMSGVATCRVCGCTDDEACEGGCYWVEDPEGLGDLCSTCLIELHEKFEAAVQAECRRCAEESGLKRPEDCQAEGICTLWPHRPGANREEAKAERDALQARVEKLEVAIRAECCRCAMHNKDLGRAEGCRYDTCPLWPHRPGAEKEGAKS